MALLLSIETNYKKTRKNTVLLS